MGRAESTMKYILCFFNLFIMFLGLVMVVIGVIFQMDWKVVKDVLKAYLTVEPWSFIIIGTLMFVIGIFGFCGPLFNNKITVFTYVIFLLVIIVLEAVIAILLITSQDTKRSIMKFGSDIFEAAPNSYVLRSITNSVQEQFECCGWSGVEDYGLLASFPSLPDSCCRENEPYGYLFQPKCTIWLASPGCKRIIEDTYETKFAHVVAIAVSVACLQIICIVAALFFINFGRERKRSCMPFFF
ncbi:unnamed protein product [Arctia plantaginis]|uniref:Tetraspanin n=1 Tax=Arctia plantaginis TaxID=874455 RepID=A0A8S1B2H7_ARCPL|nr:unnamed protein product [Arctia plantaginis]